MLSKTEERQPGFYDRWLLTLNFYLITGSGGVLNLDNFSDERLKAAYRESPGEEFVEMNVLSEQLILEFQAEPENTETNTSLAQREKNEETLNGPVSIPLPGVPNYV